MIGAGGIQQLPLGAIDAAAIPDRQRPQQRTNVLMPGQLRDVLGQALSPAIQLPTQPGLTKQAILRRATHITGRRDVIAKQPAGVVKTTRVGKAAWSLQPHQQLPALPWPQLGRAAIPAQTQPARSRPVLCLINLKLEAGSMLAAVRQRHHHPLNQQLLPLLRRRQLHRQQPARIQQRPQEPSRQPRQQPQPAPTGQQQRDQQGRQRPQPMRQIAQGLQQKRPKAKGKNTPPHSTTCLRRPKCEGRQIAHPCIHCRCEFIRTGTISSRS